MPFLDDLGAPQLPPVPGSVDGARPLALCGYASLPPPPPGAATMAARPDGEPVRVRPETFGPIDAAPAPE